MKSVVVAVGVCLLSVIHAFGQCQFSTGAPNITTNCGLVGIGSASPPIAPLDIKTGTDQAWINVASSNALPPKLQLMQSAAASLDLGVGSLNFVNGLGNAVSQVSARYPGTDQNQSYLRFTTSGAERLRIDSGGNVGLGTAAPAAPLDIQAGTNQAWINVGSSNALPPKLQLMQSAPAALDLGIGSINFTNGVGNAVSQVTARYSGTDQSQSYMRFTTSGLERLRIDNGGKVGIGTIAPGQMLSVAGIIESTSGGMKFPDGSVQTVAYPFSGNSADLNRGVDGSTLTSSVTNTSTTGSAALAAVAGNGTTSSGIAYLRLATSETTPKDWRVGMTDASGTFRIRDNAAGTDRMTISGTSITFNGNVTGTTIQASYQDVAEWVPADQPMPSGTVVVLSGKANNTVTASTHAYDTGVAGVVSPAPGLLLGSEGPSKAKIATTGRVRVRVDAGDAPIFIGDLLVTGDKPGMAMKSEPLELGGARIHRPGTLIGKALEPLASGQGEILVLLSLQ